MTLNSTDASSRNLEAPQFTVDFLGARLAQLRRSKGMTLGDLAQRLGVSRPTVWAWEKGKTTPRPERMEAIAATFGVQVEELRDLTSRVAEPSRGDQLVLACRAKIAEAYEVPIQLVRISIEL